MSGDSELSSPQARTEMEVKKGGRGGKERAKDVGERLDPELADMVKKELIKYTN